MTMISIEHKQSISKTMRKFDTGATVVCIKFGPDFLKVGKIINTLSPLNSIYNKHKYRVRFAGGREHDYYACHLSWPGSVINKIASLVKELKGVN